MKKGGNYVYIFKWSSERCSGQLLPSKCLIGHVCDYKMYLFACQS